jgi:hypothetical protein
MTATMTISFFPWNKLSVLPDRFDYMEESDREQRPSSRVQLKIEESPNWGSVGIFVERILEKNATSIFDALDVSRWAGIHC